MSKPLHRKRLNRVVGRQGLALPAEARATNEALHRPRITGKRIRYLLRPWKGEAPIFEEAEKAMKAFQDAFGVLHDDLVREPALEAAAAAHALPPVHVEVISWPSSRGEFHTQRRRTGYCGRHPAIRFLRGARACQQDNKSRNC